MNRESTKCKRVVHVVGAAIVRGGRCLAVRRGPGLDRAGKWEFPGGKVDPDETPREALRRELREELGVEGAKVGDPLARGQAATQTVQIVLDIFIVDIGEKRIELREHDAQRWLGRDELWEVDWAEPDIPAVHELEQVLRR